MTATPAPHLTAPELAQAAGDAAGVDGFFAAVLRGFHEDYTAELWQQSRRVFEPERCFGFQVAGSWVATCGAYTRSMTVPGGRLPVAAVTLVTVQPSYRRRGLLTTMMRHQLSELAQRGEPVALLWASESMIYGRYGYGQAAPRLRSSGQTRAPAFRASGDLGDGSVGAIDRAAAEEVIPALHAGWLPDRNGALDRPGAWWPVTLWDPEPWRHGASALRFALHYDRTGASDGYLIFRIKGGMDSSGPNGELDVVALDAAGPAAYAALWRFALDLDLVRSFSRRVAPADEPLRHLVADQRAVVSEVADGTWVRLVDVRRALEARAYAAAVDVVIGVSDALLPDNERAFRLEAGPQHTRVTRSRRRPDLTLDVRELGTVYLGGVRLSELHRAGLVAERTPGSVDALSTALGAARLPFCPDFF